MNTGRFLTYLDTADFRTAVFQIIVCYKAKMKVFAIGSCTVQKREKHLMNFLLCLLSTKSAVMEIKKVWFLFHLINFFNFLLINLNQNLTVIEA